MLQNVLVFLLMAHCLYNRSFEQIKIFRETQYTEIIIWNKNKKPNPACNGLCLFCVD